MNKFLPLKEYLEIAEKVFLKNVRRSPSEDELAYVVEYMIRADNIFNEKIGNRHGFRKLYSSYAIKNIMNKLKNKKKLVSLDYPLEGKTRLVKLGDIIEDKRLIPEKQAEFNELCKEIKQNLTEKEYDILIRRVCYKEKYKDIAKDYGLTKQRIQQISKTALKKVKK